MDFGWAALDDSIVMIAKPDRVNVLVIRDYCSILHLAIRRGSEVALQHVYFGKKCLQMRRINNGKKFIMALIE